MPSPTFFCLTVTSRSTRLVSARASSTPVSCDHGDGGKSGSGVNDGSGHLGGERCCRHDNTTTTPEQSGRVHHTAARRNGREWKEAKCRLGEVNCGEVKCGVEHEDRSGQRVKPQPAPWALVGSCMRQQTDLWGGEGCFFRRGNS